MELTVTGVDYAPSELHEQVPFRIKVIRLLPGPDRPDYWLGELIDPLFWINDNIRVSIEHLILCARWQGTQIGPLVENLPIGIAYVTDPTQITDQTVSFDKCRYVAIGIAHETTGKGTPARINKIFGGWIGRAFGLGGDS